MSEKRPARDLILTPRPEGSEVISWYGCPNGRCHVRHWPVVPDAGDRCPVCDTQGFFKGMVGKIPAPSTGDDPDGEDG